MLKFAKERLKKRFPVEISSETLARMSETTEMKIAITRADLKFLTPLIHELASGRVYGLTNLLSIRVLDPTSKADILKPLISLCSLAGYPCLQDLSFSTDFKEALSGVNVLIVKLEPREEALTREEVIAKEFKFFRDLGVSINEYCDKSLRVVLVGEGSTDFAYIMSKYMVLVPPDCVTGLVKHYQRKAEAKLAHRLKRAVSDVKNVFVWGENIVDVSLATFSDGLKPFSRVNISDIQDINRTLHEHIAINSVYRTLVGPSDEEISENEEEDTDENVAEFLQDEVWLHGEFNKFVTENIDHKGHYSLVSALVEHLKALFEGCKDLSSMIVHASGFYDWSHGYTSLPVRVKKDLNASVVTDVKCGMIAEARIHVFKEEQMKRYKMIDQLSNAGFKTDENPPVDEENEVWQEKAPLADQRKKISILEELSGRQMETLNFGEGFEKEDLKEEDLKENFEEVELDV